ncbi:hypothetical protein TSOC_007538 [Tetrabaena socialis]|uniref:Uncharacterized protein n=1 Tax=Tetrabaena socialis TaxID=47790 RepID=A0A2J8A0S0_9CHLO|nr:hypothetical protein TSOC_007538 [Tetrabaena socialis]|eukprot:PNH06123.1 hypothetical protein TSOC_007538 [Tetrabaena socialis]
MALALRTVPRLWTGVMATLARDVPFSALYWGMLEPVRGGLLAHWQRQELQQRHQQQQQQHRGGAAAATASHGLAEEQAPSNGTTSSSGGDGLQKSRVRGIGGRALAEPPAGSSAAAAAAEGESGEHAQRPPHAASPAGTSTDEQRPSPHQPHPAQPQPQPQPLEGSSAPAPSGQAVLAANLIAGSSAGALAAMVTTPFDVIKTRLQVGLQARTAVARLELPSVMALLLNAPC